MDGVNLYVDVCGRDEDGKLAISHGIQDNARGNRNSLAVLCFRSTDGMAGVIENFLFLDIESYYDKEYSLRKMTVPEYILDNRFETIICAVAINNDPSTIVEGVSALSNFLSQFDPKTTATVTYNALFDNSVLAWRFGFVPALMLDSMNLARATRGHILPRLTLEKVCEVLGLPHDKSTIAKVKGMHADAIKAAGLWDDYCAYSNRDNERSRDIFKMLVQELPSEELQVMDLVIRCAVEPTFHVNQFALKEHLNTLKTSKANLLRACGLSKADLMSSDKFVKALEARQVPIEYKPSPTGEGKIPALAKTDRFMEDLRNSPDPVVQALASARLGFKSTIEETRTEKLINISRLMIKMPVPLRYGGAHTHRLSGEWGLNFQNLPAGRGGQTNAIRRALIAPPGHVVISGDLAQIEARLTAWLAGEKTLLEEFMQGDPYNSFGSLLFGFEIDRKNKHPGHGFIAKTGVLGLQYQCGVGRFYNMVLTDARRFGIDLSGLGIEWTPELAQKTVDAYRAKYAAIPRLWRMLGRVIETVWGVSHSSSVKLGPITIRHGEVEGPNGLTMRYGNPRRMPIYNDEEQLVMIGTEWGYNYGGKPIKLFPGRLLQNIIELLGRTILMDAALRLNNLGYRFIHQAHDELVYLVKAEDATAATQTILAELTRAPPWGLDIPLKAEVSPGPSYGECK